MPLRDIALCLFFAYCFQVSALTVLSRPASVTVGLGAAVEEDAGGTIALVLEEGATADAVITSSISMEMILALGEM